MRRFKLAEPKTRGRRDRAPLFPVPVIDTKKRRGLSSGKTGKSAARKRVYQDKLSETYFTSTVQPWVSSSFPVWMPVTVSYSLWLTGPMPPPEISITSFS